MSAIAGIFNANQEPAVRYEIEQMMNFLRKYPANAVNIWHDSSVALGCHAQWITPQSMNETLPYYDADSGLAITADAILDNREQLCDQLGIAHHARQSLGDSELILAAYSKWGTKTPAYLIGDYAFVIWDSRSRQLVGARDQLGRRTLYYHHSPKRFAFCTVINPLFTASKTVRKLNEAWFAEFLAIPTMLDSIDIHNTVYREIMQLPPGHIFIVGNGGLTVERYPQSIAPERMLKLQHNNDYVEAFREVFQEAVNSKLRTYRGVGVRLSGGLDSGAVASFAAEPLRQAGKPLHTYSYIPSADFVDWTPRRLIPDETAYIQAITRHIGNTEEQLMTFEGRNAISEMDDMLELMEGPYKFFENSFWLKGMLERAREQDVGVMLNGTRGNYSISWGDPIDYYARLLRTFRWRKLYVELDHYIRVMRSGKSVVMPIIAKQAWTYIQKSSLGKKRSDIPLVIHPDFAARTKIIEKLMEHNVGLSEYSLDEVSARNNQFLRFPVSNHIGTSTTKLSLPYAISERDPTSDLRVIQFCLSLPDEQFVQNGIDRSLIRRATEGKLPDKVRMNINARGVQGADWIHRLRPQWNAIREQLDQLCRDYAAAEYLNVPQIKQSLDMLGKEPKPEFAFDLNARLLMRSLISYRFLRQIS